MAAVCAVLGVHVVLRGLSMIGDGLAHIAFAGVAIGFATGAYPLGLALAAAVVGALLIEFLRARGIARGDAAVGILFTAGLSVGILVISLTSGFNVDVEAYLFGNLLAIRPVDVAAIGALGAALLAAFLLLGKELRYVTFSSESARVSGVPVAALNALFSVLAAAAVVVAARVVGILLVSALLVVPASSALQLARSFRGAVLLSVAFATASALAGVLAAAQWGLATGASIALASTIFFVGAAASRGLRRT